MIEDLKIFKDHSLISDELKLQITQIFRGLTTPVTLKAVLDLKDDKSLELGNMISTLQECSPAIRAELYETGENQELEKQLDASHLPVVGIWNEQDSGIRFHGVPGGKELNSFISGIAVCGGASTPLDSKIVKSIQKIKKPVKIDVYVSLACHHCPHVVAACQKVAAANHQVTVSVYDAKLYPDLVEKYKIERVPITIFNNTHKLIGQKTIDDIVQFAQQL